MPAGKMPVSRPAAMLAALDAALDAAASAPGRDKDARRAAGIAAATGLNDLLIRHELTWDDVVPPGSRLAKLCGRLGSEYPAEREAAYDHARRLLLGRRATWSDLVRLPASLACEALTREALTREGIGRFPAAAPHARPPHARPPHTRPSPARSPHARDGEGLARGVRPDAGGPASRPTVVSPPEEDWTATVQRLKAGAALRSDAESVLLAALERGLAEGHAISVEEARWLRDIWWRAELHDPFDDPSPKEAPE